jgi:hypothetical protein
MTSNFQEKFDQLRREYFRQAKAYLLFFECSERRLEQPVREKLYDEFGRQTISPEPEWPDTWLNDEKSFDQLSKMIGNYLESENYQHEKFLNPPDRLRHYLWNKARTEVHTLLQAMGR